MISDYANWNRSRQKFRGLLLISTRTRKVVRLGGGQTTVIPPERNGTAEGEKSASMLAAC